MGTEDDDSADGPQVPPLSLSQPNPPSRLPVNFLARLLPWLFFLALLVNRLDVDIGLEAIDFKVLSGGLPLHTSSTASSAAHILGDTGSEGGDQQPLPIHAYVCVYRKDWRLVLLERPSPLYLAGTIRQIAAPVERITLLVNRINGGTEETLAERSFEQLCESLADEGLVVRCRTARVVDVADAALAYYDLTVESFGGSKIFRQSACPLVATYLEATRGDGDGEREGDGDGSSSPRAVSSSFASPAAPFPPSLVVFWEGDVSIVRPGSWLATAAAFAGAHPTLNFTSCPCFRLRNRDECTSELDMESAPDLNVPPNFRPPRLLPEDWVPFRRPRFSQQLFALPSTSLAAIDWKAAGSMPDGACGRFPNPGSFEHRACKWLARWEWFNVMQPEAAYVHTGLNIDALLELSEFLREQGWPWDPAAAG